MSKKKKKSRPPKTDQEGTKKIIKKLYLEVQNKMYWLNKLNPDDEGKLWKRQKKDKCELIRSIEMEATGLTQEDLMIKQ